MAETALFNLLIENSPYDPRLSDLRDDVDEIADLSRAYTQLHNELQERVVYLTTLVNENLHQDIAQLEAKLELLKTTSTPVFIQALAAEELMNRTIREFYRAQVEIVLLANFYVPNITHSLSTINSSHSLTTEALEALVTQLQALTSLVEPLSDLVTEIVSVTNASLAVADDAGILSKDTLSVANTIQQNVSNIWYKLYSLMQKVNNITMEIIQMTAIITEYRNTTPTIPFTDTIEELRANLSSFQYTISHLSKQLRDKETDLSYLQDIIEENAHEVDSQFHSISELANGILVVEDYLQNASNATTAFVNSVEYKLPLAQQVLDNLENFSDDTFQVAQRANEALNSVSEITAQANIIILSSSAIQQNASQITDILEVVMGSTNTAENISSSSEMIISGLDGATLQLAISSIQNVSEDSLEQALWQQMDVQSYQEHLITLEEELKRGEQLVQNSSILNAESEGLIHVANSRVYAIEVALSSLNDLESSQLQEALQELTGQLSSLESELSETDIQLLYSSLSQSLQEQRATRQELENSLAIMQDDIQHLEQLGTMLPLGCDSNL
jgi:hypothetical protein